MLACVEKHYINGVHLTFTIFLNAGTKQHKSVELSVMGKSVLQHLSPPILWCVCMCICIFHAGILRLLQANVRSYSCKLSGLTGILRGTASCRELSEPSQEPSHIIIQSTSKQLSSPGCVGTGVCVGVDG